MRRHALLLLSLCLVAALTGGWLVADGAGEADAGLKAQVERVAGPVDAATAAGSGLFAGDLAGGTDGTATGSQPCLIQADCGGGSLLVVAAVLPVLLLALRSLVPLGRLRARPVALHPVLAACRLDRPPPF